MNRAALHEGLRRMRFSTILGRHLGGEITQIEAAEMLGIHERTFRRWQGRFDQDGDAGLADRRLGVRSPKRAPMVEIERMLGLLGDKYADFTVKHFHEQLQKRHGYPLGYTVTMVHLPRAGLVRPAQKRSAHRKKRPRRPFIGMMLHQDGSRHAWLEGWPASPRPGRRTRGSAPRTRQCTTSSLPLIRWRKEPRSWRTRPGLGARSCASRMSALSRTTIRSRGMASGADPGEPPAAALRQGECARA